MRAANLLVFTSLFGSVVGLSAGCGDDMMMVDDSGSYNCATETRADTFVAGLEKPGVGGALDFQLMSADPAPPQRGDNTWVLKVSALAGGVVGNPVAGAVMTVTPFMPDHQHGTPITVQIQPMTEVGQYKLTPVNLWMPGLWETTINVTSGGGATDKVVYKFCIPG